MKLDKEPQVGHPCAIGYSSIKWDPLNDPIKILLPRPHINLGLIKQFVKALDKNSDAFKHLQNLFTKISEAKIEAGISVGPSQIRKILDCNEFLEELTIEKTAWNSFAPLVCEFLGNHKAENYVQQKGTAECPSKFISLTLIWISLRKTRVHARRNLANISIRIY